MYHQLEPKIIKCAVCETEFDARSRNRGKGVQKYCSPRCRQIADNRRHWRRHNPPKPKEELTRRCVICDTIFVTDAHHAEALTCSVKCNEARMNAKRRRATIRKQEATIKECEECGKDYTPHRRSVKRAKYCSKKCGLRAAARAFRERRETRMGPGSKRLGSVEWQRAKKEVLERDGNKCRLCGSDEKRLHGHHLFYRTEAEKNNHALDDLLTLCGSCHRKMHDIQLGKDGDDFVISGLVFDWLGIDEVRIAHGCTRQAPSQDRPDCEA